MLVCHGAKPMILLQTGEWLTHVCGPYAWAQVVEVDRSLDPVVGIRFRCGHATLALADQVRPVCHEACS